MYWQGKNSASAQRSHECEDPLTTSASWEQVKWCRRKPTLAHDIACGHIGSTNKAALIGLLSFLCKLLCKPPLYILTLILYFHWLNHCHFSHELSKQQYLYCFYFHTDLSIKVTTLCQVCFMIKGQSLTLSKCAKSFVLWSIINISLKIYLIFS